MKKAKKKTLTLKMRVRDKHAKVLSVNFGWNYINDLSSRSIRERGVFLSAFDIHPYTKGAGKEPGLHSQTLQCVASEYVTRRNQYKKAKYPKVSGVTGQAKWVNGRIYHNGHYFGVWDSRGLAGYKFRSASFSVNVVVDADEKLSTGKLEYKCDYALKKSTRRTPPRHVRAVRKYLPAVRKAGQVPE